MIGHAHIAQKSQTNPWHSSTWFRCIFLHKQNLANGMEEKEIVFYPWRQISRSSAIIITLEARTYTVHIWVLSHAWAQKKRERATFINRHGPASLLVTSFNKPCWVASRNQRMQHHTASTWLQTDSHHMVTELLNVWHQSVLNSQGWAPQLAIADTSNKLKIRPWELQNCCNLKKHERPGIRRPKRPRSAQALRWTRLSTDVLGHEFAHGHANLHASSAPTGKLIKLWNWDLPQRSVHWIFAWAPKVGWAWPQIIAIHFRPPIYLAWQSSKMGNVFCCPGGG